MVQKKSKFSQTEKNLTQKLSTAFQKEKLLLVLFLTEKTSFSQIRNFSKGFFALFLFSKENLYFFTTLQKCVFAF
jgi:hypothetical protein